MRSGVGGGRQERSPEGQQNEWKYATLGFELGRFLCFELRFLVL